MSQVFVSVFLGVYDEGEADFVGGVVHEAGVQVEEQELLLEGCLREGNELAEEVGPLPLLAFLDFKKLLGDLVAPEEASFSGEEGVSDVAQHFRAPDRVKLLEVQLLVQFVFLVQRGLHGVLSAVDSFQEGVAELRRHFFEEGRN